MRVRRVDGVHCIHLAVNWGCDVKSDQVQDYDHEGGKARKGVDLLKGQIQNRPSSGNSKVRAFRHVPISSTHGVGVPG